MEIFWQKLVAVIIFSVVHVGGASLVNSGLFLAGRKHGVGLVPLAPDHVRAQAKNVVKSAYVTQLLDHFNSSVNATWQQRYQVNEAVYKPGGPIFMNIGGEVELSEAKLTWGQMYENAKRHDGLLVQLEHRFYGQSHPTSDTSVANLRYLSSVQALADVAVFLVYVKQLYKIPDAKVVLYGGSYPGNLVTWHRLLYPNSSVGGVASSAPVLVKADFFEYTEAVGDVMKYFDINCYTSVNDAFQGVQELVAAKEDEKLNTLFGICGEKLNYDDPNDIQTFYSFLITIWNEASQYNKPGNNSKVEQMCQTMTNATLGEPIDRLSIVSKSIHSACFPHEYKLILNELKKDTWDSEFTLHGTRQWFWQSCTEFGFYPTTDSRNQPFGFETVNLKYKEEFTCTEAFGISSQDIAKSVAQTNKRYGRKTPNVTNVFFLSGSFDPWHTMSIFEHDLNKSCPSRYIEGISHCYDMFAEKDTDPPALKKARQEVAEAISAWMAE